MLRQRKNNAFPIRAPIGIYDSSIWCEGCEDVCSKWDAAAAEILLLIKNEVKQLGLLVEVSDIAKERLVVNPEKYTLTSNDLLILAWVSQSHTDYPTGVQFTYLENTHKRIPGHERRIGIIKLERLGYVERTIEHDERDGYDFYAYRITENGIIALLNHDEKIREISPEPSKPEPTGFEDDDIPF